MTAPEPLTEAELDTIELLLRDGRIDLLTLGRLVADVRRLRATLQSWQEHVQLWERIPAARLRALMTATKAALGPTADPPPARP